MSIILQIENKIIREKFYNELNDLLVIGEDPITYIEELLNYVPTEHEDVYSDYTMIMYDTDENALAFIAYCLNAEDEILKHLDGEDPEDYYREKDDYDSIFELDVKNSTIELVMGQRCDPIRLTMYKRGFWPEKLKLKTIMIKSCYQGMTKDELCYIDYKEFKD